MAAKLKGVTVHIAPSHIAHPTLAFLYNYWNTKRGTRALPSRSDIKPSELREHLGWIMIVEALPDLSEFRYRLVGTLVAQYFQSDSTGKTVAQMFAASGEAAIRAVQSTFRKTARDKVVIRCYGDAKWVGPHFEDFDSIFLPLSDDGETVNMILHAFVFDKGDVLLARQIASANGGVLLEHPKH